MPIGRVKFWDRTRGYGFIAFDGQDVFTHQKFCDGFEPEKGMEVEFRIVEERDGRRRAENIRPAQCG